MPRDMRNIRERIIVVDGKEEIHYQVRKQYKDPDTGIVRTAVRTFSTYYAAIDFRDTRGNLIKLAEHGDKLVQREEMKELTLTDIWEGYSKSPLFRQKHTFQQEIKIIRLLMALDPKLWDKSLCDIAINGTRYFSQLRDKYISCNSNKIQSFNRYMNPVRKMFRYAQKQGYPIGYPFKDIFEDFKVIETERRPLKTGEDAKVYAAIEELYENYKETYLWFVTFVMFSLATALRPSHVLKLRWKDIDLDQKLVTIPRSYINGHKNAPPFIPLTSGLLFQLRVYYDSLSAERKDPAQHIFSISYAAVKKNWRRVALHSGLYEIDEDGSKRYSSVYCLRHTASTRYSSSKFKPTPLSTDENGYLLGHISKSRGTKSRDTNSRYRRDHTEDMEWVESIREKLEAHEKLRQEEWQTVQKEFKKRYGNTGITIETRPEVTATLHALSLVQREDPTLPPFPPPPPKQP